MTKVDADAVQGHRYDDGVQLPKDAPWPPSTRAA